MHLDRHQPQKGFGGHQGQDKRKFALNMYMLKKNYGVRNNLLIK